MSFGASAPDDIFYLFACGGCEGTKEVKTAIRQEGIYAVAVCDIVFSGRSRQVRVRAICVYKTKKQLTFVNCFVGALEGTRTPDPLIRSQVLYPTELPAHIAILY